MRLRLRHFLPLALLLVFSSAPLFAGSFPASCAGTYLTQEAGGARDFWTLEADGSFFGTTSTQPLFNFSNQQGSWTKNGSDGAKGVLLAFVYDGANELQNIARIDISLETVGNSCDNISGSLEGRFFDPSDDPVGPDALSSPVVFSDTFTGRRVKARP